jgi:hypothetical protein
MPEPSRKLFCHCASARASCSAARRKREVKDVEHVDRPFAGLRLLSAFVEPGERTSLVANSSLPASPSRGRGRAERYATEFRLAASNRA